MRDNGSASCPKKVRTKWESIWVPHPTWPICWLPLQHCGAPARHQVVDASHTEKFVCLVENNRLPHFYTTSLIEVDPIILVGSIFIREVIHNVV